MHNTLHFNEVILPFIHHIDLCLSISICSNWGNNTYEFLNLSPSARATALGGVQIAAMDDDASLAFQNPSLYNESMHSQLSVNTVAYLAGINYGYVSYTHDFDSLFTGGFGIQYVSYGDFMQTDPSGQVLGSFSGGEYALTAGGARKWKTCLMELT